MNYRHPHSEPSSPESPLTPSDNRRSIDLREVDLKADCNVGHGCQHEVGAMERPSASSANPSSASRLPSGPAPAEACAKPVFDAKTAFFCELAGSPSLWSVKSLLGNASA